MSLNTRFEEWYSGLKARFGDYSGDVDAKGEELEECVDAVMADGHDEQSAYAICQASQKAGLSAGDAQGLAETAAAVKQDDQRLTAAFLGVAAKADVDLPSVCRKCEGGAGRTRMEGAFLCPTCAEKSDAEAWADFDAETSEYELAEEPDSSDRTVRFGNFGGDPFGDEDILAAFVEVLQEAGAEEIRLGDEVFGEHDGIHDRPVVVEGLSLEDAEAVWAEFEDDAQGLGGPSADVDDDAADSKADGEFAMEVFRVVAAPDDDTEYNGDLLGLGVDFPESGVYVDWRLDAFPEPLDEGHVSDYGSIEDLQTATGNEIEELQTYAAPTGVDEKAAETRTVRLDHGLSSGPTRRDCTTRRQSIVSTTRARAGRSCGRGGGLLVGVSCRRRTGRWRRRRWR